jgi:hypothetical protein
MSRESPVPLLEKFGQRLSPVLVFIWIFAGFSLMVLAGRWTGKQNLFIAYERSYPLISPEGYFYPSLDNLTELVSHVGSRRKILVLVGGNSVLLGVGQKKDQLWTKELQRALGLDFVVVNLAFRGGRPTEMGAVAAEVLSKNIPVSMLRMRSPCRCYCPWLGPLRVLESAGPGEWRIAQRHFQFGCEVV